jgi:adenine-specific DNA-methyltransferase
MQLQEVYQPYYTRSSFLVNYMIKMLSAQSGMRILEPAAGDGVFIDALAEKITYLELDAYELNPSAATMLQEKYLDNPAIHIKHSDTVTDEELTFYTQMYGVYDGIIGNPPYGGWQDYEKRKDLKKLYPRIYVKETYALFLFRCINLLIDNGKLVFIIPDTFLNLHMHTGLREYLLTHTKIEEIVLFPSSFFPKVNFGYSGLSIITLKRSGNRDDCLDNNVRILSGFKNVEELEEPEKYTKVSSFRQKDIYDQLDHAFFIADDVVSLLIQSHSLNVGDIAHCVTGIYSGDDKKYLRPVSSEVRNGKKYLLLPKDVICHDYLTQADILDGIDAPECFIPIVKGGAIKYLKQDIWYIDWSTKAVHEYKIGRKARFQNSSFYFKQGIGVPMVSSSRVTAALIERKVFDQSIVGVFPHDPGLIYYLLAFFNSPTCNILLRTINPSANNSANYVKKIPLLMPSEAALNVINLEMVALLDELRDHGTYEIRHELYIHQIIKDIYGF